MRKFQLVEKEQQLFPSIKPWATNDIDLKGVISQFKDYGSEFVSFVSRKDRLPIKRWLEKNWRERKRFITKKEQENFRSDIRFQKFHQRIWELYVSASLLHHELNLSKTNDKGPDFLLKHDGKNVWIEAVAPTQGSGPNKVETTEDILANVPEGVLVSRGGSIYDFVRPKILRITQGFVGKASNLKQYSSDNISDCIVIAINGGLFEGDMLTEQLVLGAVFGRGNSVYAKKRGKDKFQRGYYEFVPSFSKGDAPIDASLFLRDEYKHISAVIYCGKRIYESYRDYSRKPGDDFVFVYNPKALNPLDSNLFKFGVHYFWENYSIR